MPKLTFVFELEAKVKKLTAVCISDNRKYIALCEQCEPRTPARRRRLQLRVVNVQARRTICVLSGALEGASSWAAPSRLIRSTCSPIPVRPTTSRSSGVCRGAAGGHVQVALRPLACPLQPWMGSLISLSAPLRLARLNDQGHFKEIR